LNFLAFEINKLALRRFPSFRTKNRECCLARTLHACRLQ
jgi:hypothetical protein